MCIGTFISTLLITLLSVAVVLLVIHHRNTRAKEGTRTHEANPEQLALFDDAIYGFSHNTEEFVQRIFREFSQKKKGK